jgi:hypothetical protein
LGPRRSLAARQQQRGPENTIGPQTTSRRYRRRVETRVRPSGSLLARVPVVFRVSAQACHGSPGTVGRTSLVVVVVSAARLDNSE